MYLLFFKPEKMEKVWKDSDCIAVWVTAFSIEIVLENKNYMYLNCWHNVFWSKLQTSLKDGFYMQIIAIAKIIQIDETYTNYPVYFVLGWSRKRPLSKTVSV